MRGLLMMTALLPTEGHRNFIEFARNFMEIKGGQLTVMVNTRGFEPISGGLRLRWLTEEFKGPVDNGQIDIVVTDIDTAPQNPEDHPDFWNWWAQTTWDWTGSKNYDYFFASEAYGLEMSKHLGQDCRFVPYDIARDILPISGTVVRRGGPEFWDQIIRPARNHLGQKLGSFCMFGQESVGKTTIAKALAKQNSAASFQPEWARPYLETVGPDLNPNVMDIIFAGQLAQMKATAGQTMVTYRDTDLLSTIGYQRLAGWKVPSYWNDQFDSFRSSHYFLLPDDVPFEPDPLRYGGDKRETDTKFWYDLLIEYSCNFTVVPRGTLASKIDYIFEKSAGLVHKNWEPIREFKRT